MKDIVIPQTSGNLIVLGQKVTELMIENITVWKLLRKRVVFLTNQVYTIPEGVEEIKVCITGGGGGGSVGGLGGSSGQVLTGVRIDVTPLAQIIVTVGEGGLAELPGEDSSFGSLIISSGGISNSYQGDGAYFVKCGSGAVYDGTYDGTNYGGESGAFGNGGDGSVDGTAGTGGAGGGSGTTTAGKGGNGGISITFNI